MTTVATSRINPPAWQRPLFWFLLALSVRVVYLAEQCWTSFAFYQLSLDEVELAVTARRLLAGEGFGPEPLFKAPLYPLFLAALMRLAPESWAFLARALQHLAGAVLVVVAYGSAYRLGPPGPRSRWAATIAAAFLALYGPLIRLEDRVILDFFTLFLQSAMLAALLRLRTAPLARRRLGWAAAAGVLALLSWLNRPTLMPVLPFLAMWAFWALGGCRPRRARRALLGAGVFLALPLAGMLIVTARNATVGGERLTTPWQGGYNFYQANHRGAHGRYLQQRGFALNESGNPTRERMTLEYAEAHPGVDAAIVARGTINDYWYDRTIGEIRADPAAWLGLMLRKALYLVSAREIYNFEDYETMREFSRVLPLARLNFGIAWPLALASLALVGRLRRGRRSLFALFWLYAVLLGGATALFFVSGRLRMPLLFPAVVVGAWGLSQCRWRAGAVRRASRPVAAVAYAALLLLGAIASWGDWWGVRSENVRGVEYARLSNLAWRTGDAQAALDLADSSAAIDPAYPTLPQLRAQALYSLGRVDEAVAAFHESLRRIADDPVAPFNLAVIAYYDAGDANAALGFVGEAMRRQPSYAPPAWLGVRAALRLGDSRRAHGLFAPYAADVASGRRKDRSLLIAGVCLLCSDGRPADARALAARLEAWYGSAGRHALRRDLEILSLGACLTDPK